jgi:type 1 glutamine amidotransferase
MAFAYAATAAEPAKKPIKVLLITGSDVKSHDWTKTSPQLKKILDETKKFDVKIVNIVKEPGILESADRLTTYDVIVQNYYQANQPPISDNAKQNLLSFVRGGKGFVCFHLSSGSWQDWDEWHKMVGRYWITTGPQEQKSGHGPRGTFQVTIVQGEEPSPITKGIEGFEADDELYAKLADNEKINILVAADSKWSGKIEPLVFTKDYGKGRVFHFCFGHDVKALENPPVMKMFARGTEWAATGKVEEE